MIRFGSYSLVLSFGALTGATVAVALLFTKHNREANRVLAALLAVAALRLVPFIIGYAGFYDRFPWLSFAPFNLPLAIGPLLWLYVARVARGELPGRWQWHLAPAALHLVAWSLLFVIPSVEQKSAIVLRIIDPWVQPLIDTASLAGLFAYGALALRERRRYQRWLDAQFSNREEYRLTGLRLLLVAMAIIAAAWLAMSASDALIEGRDYYDAFPFYLLQSVVAWAIGLAALRDASLAYPDPRATIAEAVLDDTSTPPTDPSRSDASGSTAPAQDWAALGAQWRDAMIAGGWWCDPHFTLTVMARKLATNTTYLSRALNVGLGQSFNECVNRQRVLAVQSAIQAGSKLDLVQLGFDAGFNSKASFQRAFRRYAGVTPSEFRVRTSQNR